MFQHPKEAFLFLQKFLITKNAERFIKVSHLSKHTLKGDVRLLAIINTIFFIPTPPPCPRESPVTSVLCPEPLLVSQSSWTFELKLIILLHPLLPSFLIYSNIPFWLKNKSLLSHIDCHLKVMNRVRFRASLRSFTLFLVCTRRSLKFESGKGQKSWDDEISVLKTSKYLKPSWLKCSPLKYLPALKKVRKLLVLRGFKNESEFS